MAKMRNGCIVWSTKEKLKAMVNFGFFAIIAAEVTSSFYSL
jgi:hypothetical protein